MQIILKRFEIWLLLALITVGLWWAFQIKPLETASLLPDQSALPNAATVKEPPDPGLLQVRKVQVTQMDQGTVVELVLLGRSGTDQPVVLTHDNVELLTGEGEGVHRFYLPFDPDPMLAADEKSLVSLKYWLKSPATVLWLTYRDQTLKVEMPAAASASI